MASRCAECGATRNLVRHHVSYIPEVTKTLCRKCDSKKRRHPIPRGFPILKVHPQQGAIKATRDIINHFGCELLELETPPLSPIGVVFPYSTPLEDVERSLEIVLEDIRFRKKLQNDKAKRDAQVNAKKD